MSDRAGIEAGIRTYLVETKGLAGTDAIRPGASLLESGLIDSLGMMDLVAFLERTFAIRISDDELDPANFDTVEAIAAFVSGKQAS